MARTLPRLLAAALVIILPAVTLTACVPADPGRIHVKEGQDAALAVSDDFEVRIPGDAISGEGTLAVEAVDQDSIGGWAITLDGASLSGDAELRFTHELTGDEPAPVAVYNTALGDPFAFGGETEQEGDSTFVVKTSHFSNWFFLAWSDLLDKAGKLLASTFGPPPGASVKCDGTAHARDLGYKAELYGSTSYKWCMGSKGDKVYIKVGNPTSFPIAVEATPHMVLTNPDKTLAGFLPQLFSVVSDPPGKRGNSVFLLGAGDSYTFDVNASYQEGLQAKPSPGGYIASVFVFAADTVAMIWGKGDYKAIFDAMKAVKCGTGWATMTQSQVTDASALVDYLSDSIGTVFDDCLGKTIEKVFGSVGLLAGVIWLITGIKAIVAAGQAITETILEPNGSSVVVTPPNSAWTADPGGLGPIRLGAPGSDGAAELVDAEPQFWCYFGEAPTGEMTALIDDEDGTLRYISVGSGYQQGASDISLDGYPDVVLGGPKSALASVPGMKIEYQDEYYLLYSVVIGGTKFGFPIQDGVIQEIQIGFASAQWECA